MSVILFHLSIRVYRFQEQPNDFFTGVTSVTVARKIRLRVHRFQEQPNDFFTGVTSVTVARKIRLYCDTILEN